MEANEEKLCYTFIYTLPLFITVKLSKITAFKHGFITCIISICVFWREYLLQIDRKPMLNISDPRVKRRCKRALGFALSYTNPTNPKALSTRVIDQYFGQQQNPLSRQLRSLLLIPVDIHYNMNTGKCKQYLRNADGCRQLHQLLDPTTCITAVQNDYVHTVVDEYKAELASGQFNYRDKSNRQWHPLQNIPSEHRKRELSRYGYSHIYDIRCAAPSIILHLARDLGVKLRHTSAIEYYIKNRSKIRHDLARDLNLNVNDVKKLINMLFNGAPVGYRTDLATTQLLRGDTRTIELIKNNEFLQQLRSEIRICWHKLSNHQIDGEYVMQRTYHPDGRKKRISSRDRWHVYFSYERRVMDSVTAYLDKQHARYLIEHDGWSSDIHVDLNELTEHVRSASGIHTIEFDYEYYMSPSSATH